jgi:hypothetical protein
MIDPNIELLCKGQGRYAKLYRVSVDGRFGLRGAYHSIQMRCVMHAFYQSKRISVCKLLVIGGMQQRTACVF